MGTIVSCTDTASRETHPRTPRYAQTPGPHSVVVIFPNPSSPASSARALIGAPAHCGTYSPAPKCPPYPAARRHVRRIVRHLHVPPPRRTDRKRRGHGRAARLTAHATRGHILHFVNRTRHDRAARHVQQPTVLQSCSAACIATATLKRRPGRRGFHVLRRRTDPADLPLKTRKRHRRPARIRRHHVMQRHEPDAQRRSPARSGSADTENEMNRVLLRPVGSISGRGPGSHSSGTPLAGSTSRAVPPEISHSSGIMFLLQSLLIPSSTSQISRMEFVLQSQEVD